MAWREGEPIDGGEVRGDTGGPEVAGDGVPVKGENAVRGVGGDEDAPGRGGKSARGCSGERGGRSGGEEGAAGKGFHNRDDCLRWGECCASHLP